MSEELNLDDIYGDDDDFDAFFDELDEVSFDDVQELKFDPVPDGKYEVLIKEAELGETKDGSKKQVMVIFEIMRDEDDDYEHEGRQIRRWYTLDHKPGKGNVSPLSYFKDMVTAFGIDTTGKSLREVLREFITSVPESDLTTWAKISSEQNEDGNTYNNIKKFFVEE